MQGKVQGILLKKWTPIRAVSKRPGQLSTLALLNLSAFATTETELKLIANAATIGDSRTPKKGYSTPAARGTPKLL